MHHIAFMIKSHRQSISFTERQQQALRCEAERLGITVSDLVRRIVDQWMEQK